MNRTAFVATKLPPTCAYLTMGDEEITTCYVSFSTPSAPSFLFIDVALFLADNCIGFRRMRQRWMLPNVKRAEIAQIPVYQASATCGFVEYLFDGWMSKRALGSEFGSWSLRLISAAHTKNVFKWKTPCLPVNIYISRINHSISFFCYFQSARWWSIIRSFLKSGN